MNACAYACAGACMCMCMFMHVHAMHVHACTCIHMHAPPRAAPRRLPAAGLRRAARVLARRARVGAPRRVSAERAAVFRCARRRGSNPSNLAPSGDFLLPSKLLVSAARSSSSRRPISAIRGLTPGTGLGGKTNLGSNSGSPPWKVNSGRRAGRLRLKVGLED